MPHGDPFQRPLPLLIRAAIQLVRSDKTVQGVSATAFILHGATSYMWSWSICLFFFILSRERWWLSGGDSGGFGNSYRPVSPCFMVHRIPFSFLLSAAATTFSGCWAGLFVHFVGMGVQITLLFCAPSFSHFDFVSLGLSVYTETVFVGEGPGMEDCERGGGLCLSWLAFDKYVACVWLYTLFRKEEEGRMEGKGGYGFLFWGLVVGCLSACLSSLLFLGLGSVQWFGPRLFVFCFFFVSAPAHRLRLSLVSGS